MSEIKQLQQQMGTYQTFHLVVEGGTNAGTHEIEMPDKFNEIDAVVNIDDKYFNVNDFILGETTKLTFLEYSNPIGYKLVKEVYEELGSDAIVGFKWTAINGVDSIDMLGEGYELNFNKYKLGYEGSMLKVEMDIKRRDSQNKLLNREDVSVNLFTETDLDDLPISPLVTTDVHYKEGARSKTNFYFYDSTQRDRVNLVSYMFRFGTVDDNDLGDIQYSGAGYWIDGGLIYRGGEPFVFTRSDLPALSIEVSNMDVYAKSLGGNPSEFNLIVRKTNGVGGSVVETIILKTSTSTTFEGVASGNMKIVNESFPIGGLGHDQALYIYMVSSTDDFVEWKANDTSWSFEVKAALNTPLRKTRMLRLVDAINRLATITTGGGISVQSSLIGVGGPYYNTGISTGIFLRGVANVFLGEEKLTTSLKSLMYESIAPLLACGFDLRDDKLLIEGLDFFFSDTKAYDFTDKEFAHDEYAIANDSELSYNQILMGSKKFSTNNKGDLLNYNTTLEAVTPLKSVKTKFDKTVDAIIDEDKIQELILDTSSATNQGDDDIIVVDLVVASNFVDRGILADCVHTTTDAGKLQLVCYSTPFDTLPLTVGQAFTITSGLNAGTFTILAIDKARLTLSKSSGIVSGEAETPISYVVNGILKNRASEGFTSIVGVRDLDTCTNLRHNPKYQLGRWAPMFMGALSKKEGTDKVRVTKYKNNGNITLEQYDLTGEIPGTTTLNSSESLNTLRLYKDPLFSGEDLTITLVEVTFEEFFLAYNSWRYGLSGRGYIKVPTPLGDVDVYPFGDEAFTFLGQYNELTIKGKVRYGLPGKSLVLNSVVDFAIDEVTYDWTPIGLEGSTALLEVSLDGSIWTTLGLTPIEDLTVGMQSEFFSEVLMGTLLYFRVTANLIDSYFLKSNVVSLDWPYNTLIARESMRSENEICGRSDLEFELIGTDSISIDFNNIGDDGCYMSVFDADTGLLLNTTYGGTFNKSVVLVGSAKFRVELYNTNTVDGQYVTCRSRDFDELEHYVTAFASIHITNTASTFSKTLYLDATSTKYQRIRPTPVEI